MLVSGPKAEPPVRPGGTSAVGRRAIREALMTGRPALPSVVSEALMDLRHCFGEET